MVALRIEELSVHNFRGIRRAEAKELADSPLVTVSGSNGAGKSLLLEAIAFLWNAGMRYQVQLNLIPLVGPWDEVARISVTFRLSEKECKVLSAMGSASPGGPAPRLIRVDVEISKVGQLGDMQTTSDEWAKILWSPAFSKQHAFAQVDFIPADRTIPRNEAAQVNPSLLGEEQSRNMRQQVFQSFVQSRQILSLSGIQPFLASLDYTDLLAQRKGVPSTGDFDAITDAFNQSTGKRIARPYLDADAPGGARLDVITASGMSHGIDALSSGEQEVLGLMFFVRRLSASGGLLLIDEPELHLHPALQRSLFSILENVAERAQVWVVTHSAKLVTAAPLTAVLHMTPAGIDDSNQLTKASDNEARAALLSDLGVHPVDVLQSDMLLVVEGATDEERLSGALALPLSRAAFYQAGGAAGVVATARTLSSAPPLLPCLCIRDRDLLTEEEVEGLERIPGIFIWPNRTLENELLTPIVLVQTLERSGQQVEAPTVDGWLRYIADRQRSSIEAELIGNELKRRNVHEIRKHDGDVDRQRAYLEAVAETTAAKLRTFDEVQSAVSTELSERWERDWFKLMDGKRALGEVLSKTPFHTTAGLLSGIMHTLREDPSVLPGGLVRLRERIAELTGSQPVLKP